jgi:enoyl-CoA hydratase/carnithine racemase
MATLGIEMPLDYARKMGSTLVQSVWGSEDAVEGARAFAERRDPVWRGR